MQDFRRRSLDRNPAHGSDLVLNVAKPAGPADQLSVFLALMRDDVHGLVCQEGQLGARPLGRRHGARPWSELSSVQNPTCGPSSPGRS